MAAAISFFAGENNNLFSLSTSGLGFFGSAGFGAPVNVNSYQDSTFITNAAGTVEGPQCDNNKFIDATGVTVNGVGPRKLTQTPNQNASLNVRFTNDTAVQTQNPQVFIFDRVSTANAASGVITKLYSIVHPSTSFVNNGSGNTTWLTATEASGGTAFNVLPASPAASGSQPSGTSSKDSQHDWYLGLSPTPISIGSKTKFGLLFQVEYF